MAVAKNFIRVISKMRWKELNQWGRPWHSMIGKAVGLQLYVPSKIKLQKAVIKSCSALLNAGSPLMENIYMRLSSAFLRRLYLMDYRKKTLSQRHFCVNCRMAHYWHSWKRKAPANSCISAYKGHSKSRGGRKQCCAGSHFTWTSSKFSLYKQKKRINSRSYFTNSVLN